MRVLVSGGAGYIGSFTTRALQDQGHQVVVYDNLSYGHPEAITAPLIRADLADVATLDRVLAEGAFDAIIHFAAFIETGESMRDAAPFFQNNTGNSITFLNAAARHGVRQFVFSSTAGVYGNPAYLPIDEAAPLAPESPYAESKVLVERLLPWYERVHGIRSVILRYFNAAGAAPDGSMGQDHEPATHLLTVAIKAALGMIDPFPLFGDDYPTPDGTCIRDYIHVLDLASAHLLALEALAAGSRSRTFNVGTGTGYSNRQVIDAVRRISEVEFPLVVHPRRAGDPVELVADASLLRDELGWQPEYSALDTIVGSAWEWHRTHPRGYGSHRTTSLLDISSGSVKPAPAP